jgi:FkbM family methyltransferase
MDIGASAGTPDIWKDLSQYAIYVGFDPDLRDIRELSGDYFRGFIINKAITHQSDKDHLSFYLTKSPYCSSTLPPNIEALSQYIYSDLFTVVDKIDVPATTLDNVMEELSIKEIDWIKLDSQGIDLRLFNSINPDVRSRVLAVDIEPGLMPGYVGEDSFIEVHESLIEQGFWLSNMEVKGTARINQSTLSQTINHRRAFTSNLMLRGIRQSPHWCEARYLRSLEWLQKNNALSRHYILLWVFALIDQQPGFALDVASEYERIFGSDSISKEMFQSPLKQIRRVFLRNLLTRYVPSRLGRIYSQTIQKILQR